MTVATGAGGFAVVVALGLFWADRRQARPAAETAGALASWGLLAALTCWLYLPYLQGVLVGAGDAYHYALQVSDMVAQARAGQFPTFVGQSAYAFNGNIHTLRTAPYLLHFAAALDLATSRRLTPAGLLDLTIVLHALGLALAAWWVARSLLGRSRPLWVLLLAALYALSPGAAGTVESQDLVGTFLTLPWLPLLAWAIVRLIEGGTPWPSAPVGTLALAAIWWAHPPVAVWSTAIWAGAWVAALARHRCRAPACLAAAASAAGLMAMTAYCFVSVRSLDLGASFGPAADIRAAALRSLKMVWPDFLLPGNLQRGALVRPGFALCVAGVAALVLDRGRSAALNFLLCASAALLLLLGAVPPAAPWLWSLVPDAVVRATHDQPVQRFGVILAALLFAAAALGARRLAEAPRRLRRLGILLLALLVGLSVPAIAPARRSAFGSARTPGETAAALDSRNVYLMWASFGMFTHLPSTFTHGRTSAPWELRLLRGEKGGVIASNAAAVVAAAQARGEHPPIQAVAPSALVPTRPDRGEVLEFTFTRAAPGQIQFFGQSLYRNYALPSSGEPSAFGSAPGNSDLLGFAPDEHDGRSIRVQTDVSGISVRAYPFDPKSLPFQVLALMPLRVATRTEKAGWLETPRSWIPGYRAAVDGTEVPVARSPEGFVMLPLPAGRHIAVVRYEASTTLKVAYFLSLLALAGGLALLPVVARQSAMPVGRAVVPLGAVFLAGIAGGWLIHLSRPPPIRAAEGFPLAPPGATATIPPPPASGAVRLGLVFSPAVTLGAEPLLVTGKTGAADVVYIRYLPDHHLQLGFDHWSVGGPLSKPLEYTPGVWEQVEIEQAALFDPRSGSVPAEYRDPAHSRVLVRWNGKHVLDFQGAVYPGRAGACVIGANPVGASSCGPSFRGSILEIHRFPAGLPRESAGN